MLGKGSAGIWAYMAGFLLADLIWFTLAATGMAVLAQTAHTVFLSVKYIGAAFLMRWLNRSTGTILAGAAVTVATR